MSCNGTAKLIVNAAITGCVYSKSDNPHLPVSVEEIVQCARQVRDEGASVVHLHARQDDGKPTSESSRYIELVRAVRAACPDLILCVSLSGRYTSDPQVRSAALQSQPDLASLTLGSTNFPNQVNANSPQQIECLARKIYAAGAVPELEIFEPGFINYAKYLIKKGYLREPFYFNLLLGSLGSAPLDLLGLGYLVSLLPRGAIWSLAGIGRYQLEANVLAIAAGGHVRVGLEDNLYYDRCQSEPADNARLVRRVVGISRQMGREPASGAEARTILGLAARSKA